VARVLADAKVNLLSLLGSTADSKGSAQVVVDDIRKAKKLWSKHYFSTAKVQSKNLSLRTSRERLPINREVGQKGHKYRLRLRLDAQGCEEGGHCDCYISKRRCVSKGIVRGSIITNLRHLVLSAAMDGVTTTPRYL